MTYGYIRVSTKEQNIRRQEDALLPYDISKKNVFIDQQSGSDFQRPAYRKLMKKLKREDLLIVKSIDRLGRNYAEILEQWRIITKDKGVDILVIDLPLLDTRTKYEGITGTFIADLALQILAYVAETEREMILTRQQEGIAAAKARGVRFGRPVKRKPDHFPEIMALWRGQEISAREAGRRLGVTHMTFLKWASQEKSDKNGRLYYPPSFIM